MKNGYVIALVIVSIVGTASYMRLFNPNEVDIEKHSISKPNISENKEKRFIVKNRENSKVDGVVSVEKTSEDKVLPKINFINDKALSAIEVSKQIGSTHFKDLISSLPSSQTIEETARELELSQVLNERSEWSGYPQDFSCGNGICAVEISNILDSDITDVSKGVTEALGFKVSTNTIVNDIDGTNSIRVIGASNPDVNSMTMAQGTKIINTN